MVAMARCCDVGDIGLEPGLGTNLLPPLRQLAVPPPKLPLAPRAVWMGDMTRRPCDPAECDGAARGRCGVRVPELVGVATLPATLPRFRGLLVELRQELTADGGRGSNDDRGLRRFRSRLGDRLSPPARDVSEDSGAT